MSKTIKGRLNNLDKYIKSKWEEHYWNFIMKHEDKLNLYYISMNPNINMKVVENHPDKPWNWNGISRNQSITMEVIEKYPDKPWNWHFISRNSNLTIGMIEKNSDKPWHWHNVSSNKFTKEKELFRYKYYRIYLATFRLQQYFNRMYDNPNYLFCRTRLEKLFT